MAGTEAMAKKQRSVQLPSDVYDFAEAFEHGSGFKFNRQVLAALLQFYLDDDFGYPQASIWLSLAASVERGVSIESIPLQLAQANLKHWENVLRKTESGQYRIVPVEEVKRQLELAREKLRTWQNRIEDAGGERPAVVGFVRDKLGFRVVEEFNPETLKYEKT